jgi:hypothetical protein
VLAEAEVGVEEEVVDRVLAGLRSGSEEGRAVQIGSIAVAASAVDPDGPVTEWMSSTGTDVAS